MSCIKKFIINRNDLEYLYTEKHRTFLGIEFFVYDGKNVEIYSPDAFYSIFGSDSKISIAHAISLIENKLLITQTGDDEEQVIISCLNQVKTKISNKSYTNPNIINIKMSLLRAIYLFNKRLTLNYDDEVDYEEQFKKVYADNDKILNNVNTNNNTYEVQSIKNMKDIFNLTKDARVRTIEMQEVL